MYGSWLFSDAFHHLQTENKPSYKLTTQLNSELCRISYLSAMFEMELVELSKIESLRLVHLFVCSFAAFFLIFIWRRTITEEPSQKKDVGLLLLAGAFLMWAFMDAYRFTGLMEPGKSSLIIKTISAYNNAFFIAALPFFAGSFNFLHSKLKLFKAKTNWALVVLTSNILLVIIYSMAWKNENESGEVVNYIDLIYSILTYILLGVAMISKAYTYKAMRKSVFYVALLLSISLVLIQFLFSPLFSILHYDLLSTSSMICHTILAILLLSLGYEWLLQVRTSIVSEQNRTEEKIEVYIIKNNQLESELENLKMQISNDRSISSLSNRELEVLTNINFSYTEIADKLFISRDTVITHKKNIEAKLGVNGKKNLEEFAKKKNLIKV